MTQTEVTAAMERHNINSTRQLAFQTGCNYQSLCRFMRGEKGDRISSVGLMLHWFFECQKAKTELSQISTK